MTIEVIVEGDGEVSAVPVLLRRLIDVAQIYDFGVGRPIRRRRTELVREDSLRSSVALALLRPECSAILILFDSDDDCPKELAPQIQAWAQAEAGKIPCAVVMAKREYEAWFIAAVESLRGKRWVRDDAESHPDPEAPRDAKGHLEQRMVPGMGYSPKVDQAALTALFDMATAYSRCRSFKRMVSAFGQLVTGAGASLGAWPPPDW